jgi:hypothetical protein
MCVVNALIKGKTEDLCGSKTGEGLLVEPQNRGRARTTWEPSHEWWLTEATPSSRGLQWFTRKPLGYSVEPQNRGRRLDEEVRPPRSVQPPWSQLPRSFEAEDTHRDRKACVEAKQGCGSWASVRRRKSEDFQIFSSGACIPSYLVRVV